MLNAGWVEPGAAEYLAPNCVAEAARDFGIEDDRVWMALSQAELREGKKIGDWEIAAEVGAQAAGLDRISIAAARQVARDRSARPQEHCGISRAPGDPAADLRDRYANRRSRGFLRFRQSRSDRRNDRCDARRYYRISRPRRAFRRSASLTEFARSHCQFSIRSETPCEFPDVGYNFPSVRVMPRTGRRAPRRREDFRVRRAPQWTRREIATIRITASVSLPRRRPGDNQFCNNKFV